jgi:hypothetical protein
MTPEELAQRSAEIAESAAHAAWWSAAGSIATAILTLGLLVGAVLAWRTAKESLEHARDAQQQVKLDSIEQTRPYVHAQLVPGLAGVATWDLVLSNPGRSTARNLTIEMEGWPNVDDEITTPLRAMFETAQAIPPGVSRRCYWKLGLEQGHTWADGTADPVGIASAATLKLSYTSDDPSHPQYTDVYRLDENAIGVTPTPNRGSEPKSGISDDAKSLHSVLRAIAQNIGELNR